MSNDWTEKQVLESICVTLTEILFELKHANGVERTGAVSSVEVKYLAPTKDRPEGTPQPVIKTYAGSDPPIEEAIEAYGKALLMMNQAGIDGWERTVTALELVKADRLRAQAAD